jgi:AcrR family transcriptional regulator
MSDAALLHHFHSKAGLLEAVLRQRDMHAYEYAPLDHAVGADAIQGLIALVQFNSSTPGVIELYTTLAAEATSPDHPVHEYFVRRYETVRRLVARAFEALKDQDLLSPGVDPLWATDATIALMDGLQIQWLYDPTSTDMAERLTTHLRVITKLNL